MMFYDVTVAECMTRSPIKLFWAAKKKTKKEILRKWFSMQSCVCVVPIRLIRRLDGRDVPAASSSLPRASDANVTCQCNVHHQKEKRKTSKKSKEEEEEIVSPEPAMPM